MTEGTILTPIKEGDLLHHAEILTLRQIGATLEGITAELQGSRKDMTDIKVDVAVIKERQQQNAKLEEKVLQLEIKVDTLETRNAQQDGAYTMVTALKEFGPWLISLAVLAWGLFARSPHV